MFLYLTSRSAQLGGGFWVAFWAIAGCAAHAPVSLSPPQSGATSERWAIFAPKTHASTSQTIDYAAVDLLLGSTVMNTGPSLRARSYPLPANTGSRIRRGHKSPVWQEGNKVIFEYFDKDTKKVLQDCIDGLVKIGNNLEITTLSRDEQLAYWFNLHNLLVLSEVAKHYPVLRPNRLKIAPTDLPLHTAPLVTIHEVPLSLTDIRVNIVQRFWDDPRIIYGFFRGDIAGPNLRNEAWTADKLDQQLDTNATEFINSLRGVAGNDYDETKLVVSPIYKEIKTNLFPDWPNDFREHLSLFSEYQVDELLETTSTITFGIYHERVAALSGGENQQSSSRISLLSGEHIQGGRINHTGPDVPIAPSSSTFNKSLYPLKYKFTALKRRGRTPKITIVDIDSSDSPDTEAETPSN